jgi:hypothetical protein
MFALTLTLPLASELPNIKSPATTAILITLLISKLSNRSDIVISGWVRVKAGGYDDSEARRNSWCDCWEV